MTQRVPSKVAISYKVVLLGAMDVGKTSITRRFTHGDFLENTCNTIGAAFVMKTVMLGTTEISMHIWDTAGQERFQSIMPLYYRRADAAIVVYDITDYLSFKKAMEWVVELQATVTTAIIITLVGNKQDLDVERVVTTREAQQYADENGLFFIETSARVAYNIQNLLINLAKNLSGPKIRSRQSVRLNTPKPAEKARCCGK